MNSTQTTYRVEFRDRATQHYEYWCEARDQEMAEDIARHAAETPNYLSGVSHWRVISNPHRVGAYASTGGIVTWTAPARQDERIDL